MIFPKECQNLVQLCPGNGNEVSFTNDAGEATPCQHSPSDGAIRLGAKCDLDALRSRGARDSEHDSQPKQASVLWQSRWFIRIPFLEMSHFSIKRVFLVNKKPTRIWSIIRNNVILHEVNERVQSGPKNKIFLLHRATALKGYASQMAYDIASNVRSGDERRRQLLHVKSSPLPGGRKMISRCSFDANSGQKRLNFMDGDSQEDPFTYQDNEQSVNLGQKMIYNHIQKYAQGWRMCPVYQWRFRCNGVRVHYSTEFMFKYIKMIQHAEHKTIIFP